MSSGTRVFYVIYVPGEVLRDCIDAIRLLCSPFEKHHAHVTVRGPYERPIGIDKVNRKLHDRVQLVINGVGNFFESGQQTVFFRCSAPMLDRVWKKPSFNGSLIPHVTLYDEKDSDFANEFFGISSKYHYNLRFSSDRLEMLRSTKGQAGSRLSMGFNSSMIAGVVGEELEVQEIPTLSRRHRLFLVDRLCQFLSILSDYGCDSHDSLQWKDLGQLIHGAQFALFR